jgi:hypothetical protein
MLAIGVLADVFAGWMVSSVRECGLLGDADGAEVVELLDFGGGEGGSLDVHAVMRIIQLTYGFGLAPLSRGKLFQG